MYKDGNWLSGYLENGLSGGNDYKGTKGNFRYVHYPDSYDGFMYMI